MNKYERITEARKLLEVPERATMKEIKSSYRHMLRTWHPDTCGEPKEICEQMTARIIAAYEMIIAYCDHYRFSFSKQEVRNHLSGDEWWSERFGMDPVWGKGSAE